MNAETESIAMQFHKNTTQKKAPLYCTIGQGL